MPVPCQWKNFSSPMASTTVCMGIYTRANLPYFNPDTCKHYIHRNSQSEIHKQKIATPAIAQIMESLRGSDNYQNGDRSPPRVRKPEYELAYTFKGHTKGVASVKFSPDGKWIASCCRYLKVFKTTT